MTEGPESAIIGVFDRASAAYDAVGVDYFGVIAQFLVDVAAPQPGERVLDVGTGRGAVLFRVAAAIGASGHVTGNDLAPGMVDATVRDIDERGVTNADVRLEDAQQPQLGDATLDLITASLSLFFLPDPPAAVAAYRRALKAGGRLVFTTFAGNDPRWAWFEDVRKELLPDIRPAGIEHFASEAAIDRLLADAGFSAVSHHAYAFDAHFRKPEHWWEWSWTQTMRAAWERLDPATFATVRARIDAGLNAITAPDGSLTYHQPVRATVALNR